MTDESKRLLKEHCSSFSPVILGIIEPKKALRKIRQNFWTSVNLVPVHQNCRDPSCPNIWILAQPSVVTTVIFSSSQAVIVDCIWQNLCFRVAIIHGANEQTLRRDLWRDLLHFTSGNTVFIGDFNAVKGANERISTASPARSSCMEFCSFIDDTCFIESPTDGLRFTWSGRRFLPRHVESILDRALFSQSFADLWDSVTTSILPRVTSDHSPLVLRCNRFCYSGKRQFRFLNMWVLHPTFQETVRTSWQNAVSTSCPILLVMLKLKRLRSVIKNWNKEIFGNVDLRIAEFQRQLAITQGKISDTGYTDTLFDEEVSLQAELNIALTQKNNLLQQKSRATWLHDGDRNTSFFHRLTKFKKRRTSITRLRVNGVDTYDQHTIEQHVVEHFSALFSDDGSPHADPMEVEALIEHSVSEEQNHTLVCIPDESEIAAAVFGMDSNSAPGPDGFSGKFFHSCWETLKTDVVKAVQTFFSRSYLPTGCNSSTMILIPKKEAVASVADLRPIVLSNFLFKIISKILASRLSVVAATHVSANQFGFISGRNIHDCVMLSSEGFNCMQRTNRGYNMACKIDIKKAFDTIRWEFIVQVLRANGYHETFIRWISIIFQSARLSILFNGKISGYFACSRGVRQGDPLSPILFGIAEDVLSRLISSCVDSRHLVPMGFSRNAHFPTHLFYADDIILFCTATVRNARKIQDILTYYGSISGQICSQEKSNIYFGSKVPTERRRAIQRAMGFAIGNLPVIYLGVPIFIGRPRASYFMPIFDRIVQKFARWKGLQLSIAGRLCLVRSVIQSSIVHSMMVYRWPKSLLHSLDKKCRNFVWTGNIDERPKCSVSWGRVCAPKEEGGLGIKSFTLMNQSFLMKLAWKMIKGVDWAHKIMRSRYLTPFGYAKEQIANSSIWLGVKHEINNLVEDSYIYVNRGDSTYFWRDDWLGYKLVDKLSIPHFMHDYLQFSVQDYYYDGLWHFSASFVNKFPDIVADILLVPMGEEQDARFWKHSLKGEVSAALAFSSKCHRFPKVKWGKWIWEGYIPVRRSILCWRVLHERLPTMDILIRQGLTAPNGCPICYLEAESISHIMWSCSKVRPLWIALLSWFGKEDFLNSLDIHSFLVIAWNTHFSAQVLAIWKAAILTLMWKIWDARNATIFEDLQFSNQSILAFVKAFLKELDVNFQKLGTMDNTWSDYLITRELGVRGRVAPPPRMIEVHWWPPVDHWIKVNTDGSADGAPGNIAAGGVFRDNWASVRGCFHIKGGTGYAFEAELLAVITAINIAHDRGWHYLWIEADSMEGNQPADVMANGNRQEGWWPFAIDEIKLAVARDMSSQSHGAALVVDVLSRWFLPMTYVSVWNSLCEDSVLDRDFAALVNRWLGNDGGNAESWVQAKYGVWGCSDVSWSWGWSGSGALPCPGELGSGVKLVGLFWISTSSLGVGFWWDSAEAVIDELNLGSFISSFVLLTRYTGFTSLVFGARCLVSVFDLCLLSVVSLCWEAEQLRGDG
ncbi:uncharacterized protein LOC130990061 [Salvia miltiorrhiza]|uniref:uncharacterized protein LOC130990061 n=1 Tax=Salvia miltiorrhiza TaxID=226208 RepID=UPI0025AC3021|nr:uncharacterized protein LOC130990061 [Salvia miltiorrhiza]